MSDGAISLEKLKSLINYDPCTGLMFWKEHRSNPNRVKSGDLVGTLTKKGYINVQLYRKMYKAHRLAWFYMYGYMPINQIDHINGVKADNRISNLREATNIQNCHNKIKRSKNNTTGFLGVVKKKERFQSRITVEGVRVHLGCFDTPEEAYEAYLTAKRKHHTFCVIQGEQL
jgi:hypothetical protein